jgi:cell filamentation protein, protein adenylyltransferase
LLKLIDNLFSAPATTISLTAKLLGVTKTAASNSIKRLVDERILRERTGKARGQVFVAPEIVEFMRPPDETTPSGAAT